MAVNMSDQFLYRFFTSVIFRVEGPVSQRSFSEDMISTWVRRRTLSASSTLIARFANHTSFVTIGDMAR